MSPRSKFGNGENMVHRSTTRGGRASSRAVDSVKPKSMNELLDFDPDDVDPEELREFMSADLLEAKADPTFKERLRSRLWRIVSMQSGPKGPRGDE